MASVHLSAVLVQKFDQTPSRLGHVTVRSIVSSLSTREESQGEKKKKTKKLKETCAALICLSFSSIAEQGVQAKHDYPPPFL
ncbi:hypothetical protein OUZ56_031804 [Daphnia magna]|uniref:Uncharacterized protein n=1 Tax=Daphnia magna TaxID=35525 RepID=A0ABQ9ZV98_9CRUS|nr:hypothetical protein OUZ56_031804 [Daphnia magna]